MSKVNFTGTGIALVTPFKKNLSVDFKALENIVEHCIKGGVEYLVALGTTAETATLEESEKKEVVDCILKKNNKRLPIVLGYGGNNTKHLVDGFAKKDLKGISALLSVSPYYNKPNQKGIIEHYKLLSKHTPLPIILYNVPGRTGSNMLAETTLKIAKECKNVIAIKEASGNIEQCMRIAKDKPKDFLLISGDDNLTLPMIACGGSGVISVVGQAVPKDFANMVRAALKNDYKTATQLHYKNFELTEWLFADGNPGGIKEALKALKLSDNVLRLPLANVNDKVAENIKRLIKGK